MRCGIARSCCPLSSFCGRVSPLALGRPITVSTAISINMTWSICQLLSAWNNIDFRVQSIGLHTMFILLSAVNSFLLVTIRATPFLSIWSLGNALSVSVSGFVLLASFVPTVSRIRIVLNWFCTLSLSEPIKLRRTQKVCWPCACTMMQPKQCGLIIECLEKWQIEVV